VYTRWISYGYRHANFAVARLSGWAAQNGKTDCGQATDKASLCQRTAVSVRRDARKEHIVVNTNGSSNGKAPQAKRRPPSTKNPYNKTGVNPPAIRNIKNPIMSRVLYCFIAFVFLKKIYCYFALGTNNCYNLQRRILRLMSELIAKQPFLECFCSFCVDVFFLSDSHKLLNIGCSRFQKHLSHTESSNPLYPPGSARLSVAHGISQFSCHGTITHPVAASTYQSPEEARLPDCAYLSHQL
jgi:hypothetical protein